MIPTLSRPLPPHLSGCPTDDSSETPTPAARAWGKTGNRVKRALTHLRMTAAERAAYRRGYWAGAQSRRRWERIWERVVTALTRERL